MKKLILFITLILVFPNNGTTQTQLHGKILSTNGHPIPGTTIRVVNTYEQNIFSDQPDIMIDEAGNYSILFNREGIYNLTIYSIMHPSVRFPIIVSDNNTIELDVYILPKRVNDGRYLHRDSYRFWIRAYGNFNDFDYHSGIPFDYNDDGSISVDIYTELNPVHYKIRGISQGPEVFPGADEYIIRNDNTFEAVIPNPHGKVTLTFKPGNTEPFERLVPDFSNHIGLIQNSFFHFKNPDDQHWVYPLLISRGQSLQITLINSSADLMFDDVLVSHIRFGSADQFLKRHNERISKALLNVSDWLISENLHQQQEAASLIAYIVLINQALMFNQELVNNRIRNRDTGARIFDVDPQIAELILKKVSPVHPLWATAGNGPEILITLMNESESVIRYIENIARNHQDDTIVRAAYQALISRNGASYDSFEDMPYYNWIIDRYGYNNLARLAEKWYMSANSLN
jgi:hypothetical protein